jgi:hypothetical protein
MVAYGSFLFVGDPIKMTKGQKCPKNKKVNHQKSIKISHFSKN